MDTIVISHISTLRAIRCARRAYGSLPWRPIGRVEQRKALARCLPNRELLDLSHLSRLGFWEEGETDPLDILMSNPDSRRQNPQIQCHVMSRPLPDHALVEVDRGLYCTSPAFTALLYSKGRTIPEVLMLLLELLGTYSLPAEATHLLAHRELIPKNEAHWSGDLDMRGNQSEVNQAHYRCEPAASVQELKSIAIWAKSSEYASFRSAVNIATEGSASPGESIMYGMFAAPMGLGGLACGKLPKGGMQLNQRVNFSSEAVRMSSGIPYAICDAYIPSALTDLEYNGFQHELIAARIHDGNRNNGLKGMGIKVIVINREQMCDISALEEIAKQIYADAHVRFRQVTKGYRVKQASWLNGLRAGVGLPPV